MIQRRSFLRIMSATIAWIIAPGRYVMGAVAQDKWATRTLMGGDEVAIRSIMTKCVEGPAAFFGQCKPLEWTIAWAEYVVKERRNSIVVTFNGSVVGFFDLPAPRDEASDNPAQNAFWCGAAGIDPDLGWTASLVVFRHLVFNAFSAARYAGYEYVRCAAPWKKHPFLERSFEEYGGVTVTSFTSDEGEERFLIEWNLEDAMRALEEEGAAGSIREALTQLQS